MIASRFYTLVCQSVWACVNCGARSRTQSMHVIISVPHVSEARGGHANTRGQEDRSSLLVRDAKTIQRVCRGHIARNYVKLLRQLRLDAVFKLQRVVRMALARYNYIHQV